MTKGSILKKIIAGVSVAILAVVGLTACDSGKKPSEQQEVEQKASGFKAYIPKNDVELSNYNKAQELYDDPAAIQWCSMFPSSSSAPIITIPIAGKLTTSGTSYFSPTEVGQYGSNNAPINRPNRSVDGLFHGDSFYRYGFTPAGAYVDFSNSSELLCTTALTDFQRQNTYVEGVGNNGDAKKLDIDSRQKSAEKALKDGDSTKATDILKGK